ncbi:MAG: hypothetical protein ACM3QX_07520 [Syntrophomonadaceae bacterium]
MKAIIRFCLILLCSSVLFAQSDSDFLLPEGYSTQPSLYNISNIGFFNPSFLSRSNGISAGISYQYGSRIEKVFSGFIGESIANGLPYSAAFSYQSGDFNVAAAVTQRYNLRIKSTAGISGIIIHNPDGTEKSVNLKVESDIHDYSILSSYRIHNLPEGNSLSLGFRLSLGQLRYNSRYDPAIPLPDMDYSITSSAFALGADYKITFDKGDLSIGAYFEKGMDFQKDIQVKSFNKITKYRIETGTPDALRLDFLLDFPKFQIITNLSEVFWHPLFKDYRNSLDFSTGINYKATDRLHLFMGVYMTDRRYVNNYNSDIPDNKALFLTLGTDITIWNYTLGLSFSDSHLVSADPRKQTIGRLTLGCQF